jgi:hypothetical protein
MAFDPFTAGFDLIKTGLDKIFPDANEELKGKLAVAAAEINNEYQLQIGQLEINKIEANSTDWKVSGARPAAMWVGVMTLFYNGIGISLLSWISLCFGLPPLPIIPDTGAITALFALLGIGGLRSYDKSKGTDTKRVGK